VLATSITTANATSAAGGNQTDLLTGRCVPGYGRCVTDVLLVTTTVRVLDWVHGHTTHFGPRVALRLVLVVRATGLQDGLVYTTTTSDHADGGAAHGGHGHLRARGQTQTSLARLAVVRNDGAVVTGCAGELATITRVRLSVGNDGT